MGGLSDPFDSNSLKERFQGRKESNGSPGRSLRREVANRQILRL